MKHNFTASSITNNVKDWLENSNQPKILHIFDDVCNLINEKREILSIVTAEVGNGPFNLVTEGDILFTKHLAIDSKISTQEKEICLGDLIVSFAYAQVWNPQPDWESLRSKKDEISERLSLLQMDIENEAILQFSNSLTHAIIEADITAIKSISSKLAGLGIGLTPAGDDFLMGAMHATYIIHPAEVAQNISKQIAEIAIPLTTSLSGAWIKSASEGEAGELWHDFFDALINDENIFLPMSKILSVGETSGSDALAGFFSVMNSSLRGGR